MDFVAGSWSPAPGRAGPVAIPLPFHLEQAAILVVGQDGRLHLAPVTQVSLLSARHESLDQALTTAQGHLSLAEVPP